MIDLTKREKAIMRHFIYSVTLLFLIFVQIQHVQAQIVPSNVNVEELTDDQIVRIQNEITSRGLTIDQAAELAKAQGATQSQINELKIRLKEVQSGKKATANTLVTDELQDGQLLFDTLSVKAEIEVSEKNKQIFGYNLFNAENLTFEPSVNIPVPADYVIGISDEMTINIWGASQQTYNLEVDVNGNIQIPDLGPVHIAGKDFKEAETLINNRLIAIYSGMGGSQPNTYADISISQLRSIKVNVIGEVNAPGSYTIPATASVFNALYLSGGPNENGSFRNIKVIRQNKEVALVDVYDFLLNANMESNIALRDQDIIFIPAYTKRVAATGEFKREGYYELVETETMSNLLNYVGGFSDVAYQELLSITRVTGKELKVVDVKGSEFENFLPLNGDSIVAGKIIDRYENRVSIQGAVFRPGTYALNPEMHLSELITKAEGVTENVYSNRGVLVRLGEDLSPMTISFNVSDVIAGKNDFLLQREDQVIIRDIFSMREQRYVRVYGQVQNPGEYEYKDKMSLKDMIFLSGGLTEAASESYIEISRRHDYEMSSQITDDMVQLFQFNVSRNLAIDEVDSSFELKPYDYIYVRRAPSYYEQRTVNVKGEVLFPGEYSISNKNERVSDLIERAGGLTSYAYAKGAILNRKVDNSEIIKQSLELIGDSLLDKSEEQLDNSKLELRLADILENPGSIYDYILKEGDEITIPEEMQEIKVSGEVLNPIGLAYQPGRSMKYYIERAGGFSSDAKKGKVYVIYSDGTARVTKSGLGRKYPKPEPGCQIIIPSKPEKLNGESTTRWLSIASAFSSLAVAIAAVLR